MPTYHLIGGERYQAKLFGQKILVVDDQRPDSPICECRSWLIATTIANALNLYERRTPEWPSALVVGAALSQKYLN